MEKKAQTEKISVFPRELLKPENFSKIYEKRDDMKQEELRNFIISNTSSPTWDEVIDFDAIIPERTWEEKPVDELVNYAHELGDGIINLTRISFLFFQMLKDKNFSEDVWFSLANEIDNSDSYRLIEFCRTKSRKNYCMVGDCKFNKPTESCSFICNDFILYEGDATFFTTPWVYRLSKSSEAEVNTEKKLWAAYFNI